MPLTELEVRLLRTCVVLSCCALLSGCGFFDSNFLQACETAIKDRLRSPSGYRRVSVFEGSKPLSVDEYVAATRAKGLQVRDYEIEILNEGEKKPALLTAYVEYDAPNAYGVAVRDTSSCEHLTDDGTADGNLLDLLVVVDGENSVQRNNRILRESAQ